MPKGLKSTSSLIMVSASVAESAANTFTSQQVDLQLNPLDNEVFVVYAIDIDLSPPDLVAGSTTAVSMSVSTTQRTTIGGLDQANVLSDKRIRTQEVGGAAVTNEFMAGETPATTLPYIGIIATDNFFLNIEGFGNGIAKSANARLYGERMKADASVYAALVQSEVLSA